MALVLTLQRKMSYNPVKKIVCQNHLYNKMKVVGWCYDCNSFFMFF